jgi:predicted deacetylase
MARGVRLLSEAHRSKACTITAAKQRLSIQFSGDVFAKTDKLRNTIAKLESEKRALLDEKRILETKAMHGWTCMSRRHVGSIVMLGILMTAAVVFVPAFFIDPFVSRNLPLSALDDQMKLVSYLREVQVCQNVFLAVHGYDHKCPIDGSVAYELTCPSGQLSFEEIERRIEAGIKIFEKCGLEIDSYAFPGQAYDQRVLSVLSNYAPTASVYNKTKPIGLGLEAGSSLTDPIVYDGFREYTWMWRNGVSEKHFQDALTQLRKDKPSLLLVHVQDITNQTLNLLEEYALLQGNTGIIRLDDVTFNSHVQATKQTVDLAIRYKVNIFLAVIPASPCAGDSSSYFSNTMFNAVCVISTSLLVLPTVIMIPWALVFKAKKRKPYVKWNPHYPTVSVILPAYNEANTIAESVERALNQRYKGSIEVIVPFWAKIALRIPSSSMSLKRWSAA